MGCTILRLWKLSGKHTSSDQQQYIAYNALRSKTSNNRFGVPQGSNLGPVLFLIYINDIPNALNSPPRLFAGDTCLITHAPNPIVLNEKVNQKLVNICRWTKANKLTANPNKSYSLIISPKKTDAIPSFQALFNNSLIELHNAVKYLGITIDCRLIFSRPHRNSGFETI